MNAIHDSFVLYTEYYEDLLEMTDEEIGQITKAIFLYQINGQVTTFADRALRMFFNRVKSALDNNSKKWEETKNARSNSGSKHKGNQYTRKTETENTENSSGQQVEQMEQTESAPIIEVEQFENKNEMEQMEQNFFCSKNGTNGTVTVTVTDNVNVTATANVEEQASEQANFSQIKDFESVCNLLFKTQNYIFSKDFAPKVLTICQENNVDEWEKYLKFVLDKAKKKNPSDLQALFYTLAKDNSVLGEYQSLFMPKEIPKKIIMWKCPICEAENAEYADCACGLSYWERLDNNKIQKVKDIQSGYQSKVPNSIQQVLNKYQEIF